MKSIKTIIVSAEIVAGSLISVAQVNVGTLKVYKSGSTVSTFNLEDVESMNISPVGVVSTFDEAATSLRSAINYMLNYANEPSTTWTPHKYEYQRALLIDNYAGYWTTTRVNFGFGPAALPTLYAKGSEYMYEVFNASVPVFTESRAALVSAAEVGAPYLRALALIVQAYGAQELVDFYGVLPLKELRNWDGNVVNCESGPEVYKQILTDLDEAISILKRTQPSETELGRIEGTSDYGTLFDRKWQRWVKFANSLKLRMAMNIVDYTDPNPVYGPDDKPFVAKNIAEEAYSDEIGVLKPGDRDIAFRNPGGYDSNLYFLGKSWNDIRLNASMENILKRYNHPLRDVWFSKNDYVIKNQVGETAPTDVYGVRAGIMMEEIERASAGYGPYSVLAESQRHMDQPVMKVAEVNFLRAEGALRGWNMGGPAADLYEAGIRHSFSEWGLTESDATEYLARDAVNEVNYIDYYGGHDAQGRVNVPVEWRNSDTKEVLLEKIITQKWIANFPMGAEAWTTYRRTGYPRIFPVEVNRLYDDGIDIEKQIRRLKYRNSGNSYRFAEDFYGNVASALGAEDVCGTPVFWDINSRTWEKGANGQYIINNHLDDK